MKAIARIICFVSLTTICVACGGGDSSPTASRITDSTPPVISLIGNDQQIIALGDPYTELGATATDNVDGDLTTAIVIDASAVDDTVPGTYLVTYNVRDAAGNAADTVTRTVIYEDQTPPVITSLGDDPQIILLGNPYIELGATATDNVDGDLTASIVIDASALDLTEIGDYLVTYDVSDAAGNAAVTVTRTVWVQLPVPVEPTVSVEGGIKRLVFTWTEPVFTDFYRLPENTDGRSGFTQVGQDIPAGTLSVSRDIAVHLFDWVEAQYIVEACNAAGCSGSGMVTVTDVMLDTIGYFKASNAEDGDRFGKFVGLSADGRTLAVGAIGEDSAATGINGDQSNSPGWFKLAGAVYVFDFDGSAWYQQAYIKASNTVPEGSFGSAVALAADGNTLAVSGATGVDGEQGDNSAPLSGAVYLFGFDGSAWSQQAYVKASNTDERDHFGSVALSADGHTLAVGAYQEDGGATGINGDQSDNSAPHAGAVYVY